MPAKQATIYDVAREAKVSFKTVSRTLNGEASVRPATRQRVIAAVEKLSYAPNRAARRLAGSRSYTVALFYDGDFSSYIAGLQLGMITACVPLHYELILHPCDIDVESPTEDLTKFVNQTAIDGVVVTPPLCDNRELISALEKMDVKHVTISPQDHDRGLQVYFMEYQAAYDLTAYLIELGHRRIGFIKGDPAHSSSASRYEAYKTALRDAGLRLDTSIVARGSFNFQSGVQGARKILNANEPPTAIFASDDDTAVGAMHYAHDAGIEIPANLSIAGFDDVPISRYIWPPLTTVRQPIQLMGTKAAQLLIDAIHADKAVKLDSVATILEYEIIERNSCAPPRQPQPR